MNTRFTELRAELRKKAPAIDPTELRSPRAILRHLVTHENLTDGAALIRRCLELRATVPCLRVLPDETVVARLDRIWASMRPTNAQSLLLFALHRAKHGKLGETPPITGLSSEMVRTTIDKVRVAVDAMVLTAQHLGTPIGFCGAIGLCCTVEAADGCVWIEVM